MKFLKAGRGELWVGREFAYPTNPVLLICLGLMVVSYPKWLRWALKLWLGVLVITVAFLALEVAIRFGPF